MYVVVDLINKKGYIATDTGSVSRIVGAGKTKVRRWFDRWDYVEVNDYVIVKNAERVKSDRHTNFKTK